MLLFTVRPPETKYRDEAARVALFEEIERRVASIPGVASAAVANEFPLRGGGQSRRDDSRGDAGDWPRDSVRRAGFQAVSPGYFATLRIPLVRGRLLAAGDRAGAPPAAVVNETFARRFLAGRDPIGQRFRRVSDRSPTRPSSPSSGSSATRGATGHTRISRRRSTWPRRSPTRITSGRSLAEVAVRAAAGDPRALLPAIQRAVWSIDPTSRSRTC